MPTKVRSARSLARVLSLLVTFIGSVCSNLPAMAQYITNTPIAIDRSGRYMAIANLNFSGIHKPCTVSVRSLDGTGTGFDIGLNDVRALAFSLDGRLLAAAEYCGSIRVFSVPEGRTVWARRHHALLNNLVFTSNQRYVVSSSRSFTTNKTTIEIWDVANGRQVRSIDGWGGPIHAIAASADPDVIATAGNDGIKVWSLSSGTLTQWPVRAQQFWSVAFGPDGKTIAAAGGDGMLMVDIARNRVRWWLKDPGYYIAACGDGRHLVFGHVLPYTGGCFGYCPLRIELRDVGTGRLLRTILDTGEGLLAVSKSSLAIGNRAGKVRVLDEQANLLRQLSL